LNRNSKIQSAIRNPQSAIRHHINLIAHSIEVNGKLKTESSSQESGVSKQLTADSWQKKLYLMFFYP
jgi:hypothetical protein